MPPKDQTKITIFLVEDNPSYRQTVETMLSDQGYRVFTSETGEGVVDKIAAVRPHLCVLDIELPGMMGTEICRRLRQMAGLESMPIVLATGNDSDVNVLAAVTYGAVTLFSKARSPEVLLGIINSLVQGVRASGPDEVSIVTANFCIDPKTQKILFHGNSVAMPPKSFALARLLVQERPRPINRQEIMRRLGMRHNQDKEIDVLMHTLRAAFGPAGPKLFRNSRGRGFFFDESGLNLPNTPAANS